MPTVIDFDGTHRRADLALRARRAERRARAIDAQADEDARRTPGWTGSRRATRIVADLRAVGALVTRKPYRTKVPVSSRTGEVIEPLLSLQWFVRDGVARQARARSVPHGSLRFVPERFGRTYEAGLENAARLEHLAPGLVGPSASGLVHAGRRRDRRARRRRGARASRASATAATSCGAIPTRSTPGSPRACGRSRSWAGPSGRPNSSTGIPTR